MPVTILRFSMVFGRFEVCKWSQFYTGHFLETYKGDLKNTKTFNLLKEEILKGNKLIIPFSKADKATIGLIVEPGE